MSDNEHDYDDRRAPQKVELPGWVNLMGSVLGIVLTFGVGYIVNTVTTLQGQVTEIQTQVVVIQTQIKDAGSDRYRGADARRDFALRDQRLQNLSDEIRKMAVEKIAVKDRLRQLERIAHKKDEGTP